MNRMLNRSRLLISALVIILVACLTGGTILLSANAQDEPTSTVKFTSFTTVMKVGETFEFAAEVTLADGTTSNEVTYASSDDAVVSMAENVATAKAEGTATITATATDGAYASIDVFVSDTAIRVESIELYPDVLELGVGWKTRVGYTILPEDATDQRVTWTSSDPSIITVDENGNVETLAEGTATITATTYDKGIVATASVTVYADLGEAAIAPETLTTTIGQITGNELTVTLPEGIVAAENGYKWYSSYDSVASVDFNDDATGSVFSWSFGTTTIYVVVTDTEGNRYVASATVHVTAEYFYLTGLESILANPEDDPWVTYPTEDAAREAGVLLVPDENNPYVYSITRSFWANDIFQIIHNDMDEGWTTKITSAWFVEQGSTMDYVANTADSFGVNALGTYTVTLDLSDGRAKVTIVMDDLVVTGMTVSVAEESAAYFQYEGPEGAEDPAAARTMLLDVTTLPAAATYGLSDVQITIPEAFRDYVSAEAVRNDEGNLQIRLTMLQNYTNSSDIFTLGVKIENATAEINVTILADGETFTPVTEITFENAPYILNVNNGTEAWNTPINANVNSDASVKDIVYSSGNSHLWFEYINGQAYAHADALGTYTITATALGNSEVTATTKVLVTSLIGEEEPYQSGFYLIGQLRGEEVENWTSIPPEQTTFEGSAFENWILTDISGDNTVYSGNFDLIAHDVFSIAFLGMDGNWFGIIDNQYMNWTDSIGTYWENGINIEMSENGKYTITLDLSGEVPSFKIERIGDYNPETEYDLWLYIVRCGDAWNADISEQENIVAIVGSIHMVNGTAQSMTLTIDAVDFYEFYTTTGEWPDIQFVTAYGGADGTGIEGGYFLNETWYGSAYTAIAFSGDAYSATGESGHFTNYDEGSETFENRSELYWVGDITVEVNMTVSFTFTFDENGVLTAVELNFVSATESAE